MRLTLKLRLSTSLDCSPVSVPTPMKICRRDFLKNRGYDRLHIALIKMRIGLREFLHELGLGHCRLARLPGA